MSDGGFPAKRPDGVVAIDMGYGHLRPATALAERLGVPVLECDRPPLAGASEQKAWARTRSLYEGLTRLSQQPAAAPLRSLLAGITAIPPLHPVRDQSAPTTPVKLLRWLCERGGLGAGLIEHLRATGAPLLTTFFAPAVMADHLGAPEIGCVVTDADINRVWAPFEPARTRVRYFAPSMRVVRRLRAYGVPGDNIEYTGFPLPHELLGGPGLPRLRANLAARLARLDPRGVFLDVHGAEVERELGPLPMDERGRAPRLSFAVGGAGAQSELAFAFLPGLARALRDGRLRLTLVAGIRPEVAARFEAAAAAAGLVIGRDLDMLFEPERAAYFRRFNALLDDTDILWTKPSEITFFAALGLGMVFSWPVGEHERYNRRWAIEAGAGLRQRDARWAGDWLADWLADGALAAAAWNGFKRLPKRGLYQILAHYGVEVADEPGVQATRATTSA